MNEDKELASLKQTGWEIRVRIEKADKATKDAEDHYISAGRSLKQARIDVQRRADITWAEFCDKLCHISQRRANDYIQMVDGRKTLAQIRETKAASVRECRQRKADSELRSSRSPGKAQQKQQPDEKELLIGDIGARLRSMTVEQIEKVSGVITSIQAQARAVEMNDEDTDEDECDVDDFNMPKRPHSLPPIARVNGFFYRAEEAVRGAAVDDMSGLKITEEMCGVADTAAGGWKIRATHLRGLMAA